MYHQVHKYILGMLVMQWLLITIVHTFLIAIMYWYVCRLWTVHSIGQQNQRCAIVGTPYFSSTLVVYNLYNLIHDHILVEGL